MPYTAGSTTLAAAFGTTTTSVAVAVKETYAPTWPGGVVVNDTALTISANMTEAYELLMQAVPSAQLDLVANPPAPADVIKSECGSPGSPRSPAVAGVVYLLLACYAQRRCMMCAYNRQ